MCFYLEPLFVWPIAGFAAGNVLFVSCIMYNTYKYILFYFFSVVIIIGWLLPLSLLHNETPQNNMSIFFAFCMQIVSPNSILLLLSTVTTNEWVGGGQKSNFAMIQSNRKPSIFHGQKVRQKYINIAEKICTEQRTNQIRSQVERISLCNIVKWNIIHVGPFHAIDAWHKLINKDKPEK